MAIIYIPIYLIAFLGGIMTRSFFAVPVEMIFLILGAAFGFSLVLIMRRARIWWVAVFVIFCFFLGLIRLDAVERNVAMYRQRILYGKHIDVRGLIFFTEVKLHSQRLMVRTAMGNILVVTAPYPRYSYDDEIDISGILSEPNAYGSFDAKNILARDQIFSEMIFPDIRRAHVPERSGLLRPLFSIKNLFERNIRNILPEPHASLANGMLLGDEGTLDSDVVDDFRKSGTVHILVLSGYNITVVGVFIMGVLGYLFPQYVAWAGSVVGIVLFTVMTGSQAPAVRSAIMAVIGLVAIKNGRKNAALFVLLWAAFLMVLWNPMTLRWDRGFQLSFLATLGLIVASPVLQKKLTFLPASFGIRDSGASTIAAQIFVLPLLLSWGSEISALSPIANIFIVGLVPLIMLFSFIGGVVAFVTLSGGQLFASVAYMLISFQIFVAQFVANIPMSIIAVNGMPMGALTAIYALLFYVSARFYIAEYRHAT